VGVPAAGDGKSTALADGCAVRHARGLREAKLGTKVGVVWTTEDDSDHFHDSDSSWPDEYALPRRRRMGAFFVSLAMLLGLGLLGWAGEVRYHLISRISQLPGKVAQLPGKVVPAAPGATKPDPRAAAFVADGERALSEGDLDTAQGDFDKASVLTDRDPRVLVDEARVAAAKADVPWLRVRLLPADATGGDVQVRMAKAELADNAATARRAATNAVAEASGDTQAVLAMIDALRIAGDLDAARARVAAVLDAPQAQTAYVLAALDLAQQGPPSSATMARLRAATLGEGGSGRARAALVYALATSGDTAAAKTELAKLEALARPYPLLRELNTFVSSSAKGSVGVDRASVAPSASPVTSSGATEASASPQPRETVGATAAAGGEAVRAGASGGLEAAADAVAHRDLDRAERIYQGILAGNPGDSQAVAGLGDVAKLRGDSSGAISAYRRAITINPSYLPAALGLADTEWSRGNRAGAARVYKDIVSRFPEGTYPSYAVSRAAGGS